jgi:hypothetical protein
MNHASWAIGGVQDEVCKLGFLGEAKAYVEFVERNPVVGVI